MPTPASPAPSRADAARIDTSSRPPARRTASKATARRFRRAARRWLHQLRRLLGIRRGVLVDGVYYKELTPESLQRALSKKGAGHKDYRVTFPDRSKLIIRCSNEHIFADLLGPVGLDRLEPLLPMIRPGSRVLEFGSGTGYRAHWLSYVVGPSGGVVAIATNPDDVTFSVNRYPRPNIAFERAESFGLAGETDGAFDAVVLLAPPPDETERRTLVNELWRLTAPGGAMLVGNIDESDTRGGAMLATLARQSGAEVRTFAASGRPTDTLLNKPRLDEGQPPRSPSAR
jgi:predicted O-methyltransferase YrrM